VGINRFNTISDATEKVSQKPMSLQLGSTVFGSERERGKISEVFHDLHASSTE
jgi:hypothetical protein